MGTIAQKGAYLNDTKSELKQAINNLGGSITDETTFRQYVNQLDNVYDVLPKTEFQEGTEVTIENGLKGKLDFDDGKVGFGQASQESTNGYQLWKPFNFSKTSAGISFEYTNFGEIKINGTATAQTYSMLSTESGPYQISLNAGTYILSGASANVRLDVISSSGNALASTGSTEFTATFTLTETTNVWLRARIINGTTVNNETIYPMIETGSTAHDWEQYSGGYASPSPNWEQPIQCVTGNQSIVESGKNLFDKNAVPVITNNLPITILDTGVRIANIQNNTSYVFNNYKIMDLTNYVGKTIRAKANFTPSGNNTAKYYIGLCDVNGNNRVQKANGNVSGETISYEVTEISGNSKYLCIVLYANNGGNALKDDYVDFTDLIITIDNEDMSYEPYITPTSYQLSLGDKKLYDECYIVGSPDNWKFVDNYYKEKFNQTTIERATTSISEKYRFKITPTYQAKAVSTTFQVADILSNILSKTSADGIWLCSNGIGINSSGSILMYHEDFSAYTGDQMRGYFANNDDYIVYPLATPIETPITDETLISQLNAWYNAHSNNGTTILESNGDLPMIIKVRALKGE